MSLIFPPWRVMPHAALRPPSTSYDADAEAIFAAFSTPPDDTRKGHINTLVLALKAASVWSKLDVLYLFAAADSQAAKINWKNPATFTASEVNSPSFTTDRGFAGNGSSSYVNSTFNPSTAGGNWTLNSAHMGGWLVGSPTGNQAPVGMASGNEGIVRLNSPPNQYSQINGGTQLSPGLANPAGFHVVTRPASADMRVYINATQNGNNTSAAGSIANTTVLFGRSANTFYGNGTIGAGMAGGGLSGTNVTDSYNAIGAYLTAVGAV